MSSYLDSGYTAVKMKVGGKSVAEDLTRIEVVFKIAVDGSNLAVGVNGKFNLQKAIEFGRAVNVDGKTNKRTAIAPRSLLSFTSIYL
jgi:L-alanine-DL-glutamate epimerase-like enolase superfamily enzyme